MKKLWLRDLGNYSKEENPDKPRYPGEPKLEPSENWPAYFESCVANKTHLTIFIDLGIRKTEYFYNDHEDINCCFVNFNSTLLTVMVKESLRTFDLSQPGVYLIEIHTEEILCRYCDAEVFPAVDSFCTKCGNALPLPSDLNCLIKRYSCGGISHKTAKEIMRSKFCGGCGKKL